LKTFKVENDDAPPRYDAGDTLLLRPVRLDEVPPGREMVLRCPARGRTTLRILLWARHGFVSARGVGCGKAAHARLSPEVIVGLVTGVIRVDQIGIKERPRFAEDRSRFVVESQLAAQAVPTTC
jgi:hypothetical protein